MKVSTKIDWSGLQRMTKDLERLEQREVKAGFDDSTHEGSGLTNAQLAGYLETGVRRSGSGSTPPRPFIRQAATIWASSIERESNLVVKNILKGKEAQVSRQLDIIASLGVDSLQNSMELQNFAALAPSTLRIKAAKGSRHPTDILLDSGELFQSVVSEVK
jgi:hypothetical protein